MPRVHGPDRGSRGEGGLTHTPLRNDADPEWEALHAAAEQLQASLSRLLLRAFAGLETSAALIRLRFALRAGNIEAAMQAVPVANLLLLRPMLERALLETAVSGAGIAVDSEMVVRLGTSAGLPVAQLTYWARTHSAGLVVGITDQTRRALRQVIVDALQAGLSPAKASRLIEAVIGLNTVQARALWRRAAELLERGVSAARSDAILARYARQLIRQRARVIARHELLTAANEGRRTVWEQNVRDGLIAPQRWEREWVAIVPNDGRTCPICEGLDGTHAVIGGLYPDGSDGPPAHVLCRCTEVLRRVA